jgi:hypothetical protein
VTRALDHIPISWDARERTELMTTLDDRRQAIKKEAGEQLTVHLQERV